MHVPGAALEGRCKARHHIPGNVAYRGRHKKGAKEAAEEAPAEEVAEEEAPAEEPDLDLDDDNLADWNIPSWQELIASLYRPDK